MKRRHFLTLGTAVMAARHYPQSSPPPAGTRRPVPTGTPQIGNLVHRLSRSRPEEHSHGAQSRNSGREVIAVDRGEVGDDAVGIWRSRSATGSLPITGGCGGVCGRVGVVVGT